METGGDGESVAARTPVLNMKSNDKTVAALKVRVKMVMGAERFLLNVAVSPAPTSGRHAHATK
jgi:hypothetical protein